MGTYIGNICKIFSGFVKAEHRTPFNEQKYVQHLTNMIPGLRISRDFQLVTKPSYLNRLIRRHAPISLPPNDDTDSSSNEDSTPIEQSVPILKPSALNPTLPTLVLEKCDSLLTQKRQSFSLENSMNAKTVEISSLANHEPSIDECASGCSQTERMNEGEADVNSMEDTDRSSIIKQSPSTTTEDRTSNDQNSTILFTIAVTSMPSNEILTTNDANDRKEAGLTQNLDPELVNAVNNGEKTTSTPMQSINSQTNEPQRRSNFEANQIANIAEKNDTNRNDSAMNLPLSTASKQSEKITMNCDWEELLDKYQNTIQKRQRINRKIILERERAHLMQVNQLKSLVNVLQKKNHKLHKSVHKMEEQHSEQLKSMLKNAIDKTKRKKWCWNCQIELTHVVFNIPMCKDCLNQNW